MRDFIRALTVTLAAAVLLFVLSTDFVLINEELSESGFASGEVLFLRLGENAFSGEIMGEEFYLSTAPAEKVLGALRPAVFVLPPPVRFILRMLSNFPEKLT